MYFCAAIVCTSILPQTTVLDGKEDITKKTIIEEDLEKKIVV